MSVELLKLQMDPRTMKDLEPLMSQNPSIVYCTKWHPRRLHCMVHIPLFPWFPHYNNVDIVPDFVTINLEG